MPDYPEKQFFHLLKEFTQSLADAFPEQPAVSNIKIKRNSKNIIEIVSLLDPHAEAITQRDESIFDNAVILLPNIDFSRLWKSADISEKTKTAIWEYLQGLMLLGKIITSPDSPMLATLGNIIKTAEDNARREAQEDASKKPNPNNAAGLPEGIFKKSSIIEGLFNDLLNDIGITDIKDLNVADAVKSMLSGGKDGNVTIDKLKQCHENFVKKLESGEIKEDELKDELQDMIENLMSKSKEDPSMPDLSPLATPLLKLIKDGEMPDPKETLKTAQSFLSNLPRSNDPNMPDMSQMVSMVSDLMGGNGPNSASGKLAMLSQLGGLMGTSEDELPDLEELKKRARKEERTRYRADAEDYRAKLKRETLQNRLQARQMQIKDAGSS